MKELLARGHTFELYIVNDTFRPNRSCIQVGDTVTVLKVGVRGLFCAHHHVREAANSKFAVRRDVWIPYEAVVVWEAWQTFWPDGCDYLRLVPGDLVIAKCRYQGQWQGWGYGWKLGATRPEAGLFHYPFVEGPFVLCRLWELERGAPGSHFS